MRYYRIQQANRNATDLLNPTNWTSTQWNGHNDEDTRNGVSVCRTINDLIEYFAQAGGDPSDCNLIELEGTPAEDDDHDTHLGALLIHPTNITNVQPVTADIEQAISDRQDEILGL